MKSPVLALSIVIIILSTPARAQQAAAPPQPTTTEQEVLSLSRDKWRWMADRKVDSLAVLFDAQANFVHMGGTMTREQELEVIRSGAIHYKRAEIFESSARFIDSTAIVLQRIRLEAVVGGNTVTTMFAVTEVYVRQRGTWKLGVLAFSRLLAQ